MGEVVPITYGATDAKEFAQALYDECYDQALTDVFNTEAPVVTYINRDDLVTLVTEQYIDEMMVQKLSSALFEGNSAAEELIEELAEVAGYAEPRLQS